MLIRLMGRYGQHLSKDDVDNLIAPHPESVEVIESWLVANGLDLADVQHSSAGDWITISVSVAQAERMLGTNYNTYHHADSNDYVIRAMHYSLPGILHEHVDVMAPTTYFGTMKSMKATNFIQSKPVPIAEALDGLDPLATIPASCSRTITPSCLRAL